MEKDKIFFAEDGITTTSANYIANLAKESYKKIESQLNNVVFYTTEIGLLGSRDMNTLKEGNTIQALNIMEEQLMEIAQLKSLIAWLREAIKAKENLIKEAQKLSDEEIAKALGITIPDFPTQYVRKTENDIVGSWGIKQRNRFYYLDTVCATIGTYIHPDGSFAEARESLMKVVSERYTTNGNGRDLVIYKRTPTVGVSEVDETFFALQDKYREYQAELNSMKHQIEEQLQEDDREKSALETSETQAYQAERLAVNAKISEYKKEAVRKAQSLKIVIPDSLKDIYSSISKMGKDK